MTGINPSARPTSLLEQARDGLKQGIRDGTLQVGKIQLLNASAETKAKVEQQFQSNVQQLEQQKADYRSTVARTTGDTAGNAVTLPDVAGLSKADAQSMLSGLRQMQFVGDLDGKTLSARNASQTTDSLGDYMKWLQARVGIDVYA